MSNKKGQSLVELLMVIGLAAVLMPSILTGFMSSRDGRAQQKQRSLATALMKETQEETRNVRERGWSYLAPTGTYHPALSGSSWGLVSGSTGVNGFDQQVVVADVYRNTSGAIVISPTPGTLDPSTKKISTTISWTTPRVSSINDVTYLTRFRDNLPHPESTTADFTPGTKSGTDIDTTIGDGAVVLKKNLGNSDWCFPNVTNIPPLAIDGNGIGIAVASVRGSAPGQPNYSYITTGNNAASDSLFGLSISDPARPTPPVPTVNQHYNSNKDYGVFANNSYVFVTSDHPGLTVDIINKSTFLNSGFYDSGARPGYSVYVSGNTGYVTSNKQFDAFDVGIIKGSSSQSKLWSKNLLGNATGQKVIVFGNYAYIATSATSSSQQLQVIDLTSHTIYTPPSSGANSINTSKSGVDVAVLNNYAYLITSYTSTSIPDIFVIDISTPTAPKVVGTANTNYSSTTMDPLGIATTPNNKIIVVGSGGYQYQVFDVSTPTSPGWCGPQLQNPNGAQKIAAISTLQELDGDVYSYVLTTNGGSQQFQIIEGGGGGGGGYVTTGYFESNPFDPGYSTAFNNFIANVSQNLASINVIIKVAVVNKVNNNCAEPDYSSAYLDPVINLNNNSQIKGTIPFGTFGNYVNPGQCFRYRVTLNGDGVNLSPPSFNDITINYSP